MTRSSRASRREAARRQEQQRSASRWLLPAAGIVIAVVAVIAVVLGQGSPAPGASPSASSGSSGGAVVPAGPPTITGSPLPTFTGALDDPAKGLAAPIVEGHDYAGNPVGIAPNGEPIMVIFAAHWCAHCQREVPLIQDWVDAGRVPSDVDLVLVSTGIDPNAPNYPPEEWLARDGWTAPVIVDPTDTVAAAYGLASYPYFVILDGEGKVFARLNGEIPVSDLERILAAVPRG
jgi:thiol-disulfide isomerase/thioredoxin